jgi:hypothetical protein
MQREYDKVKLHITVMNTLFRKDPTGKYKYNVTKDRHFSTPPNPPPPFTVRALVVEEEKEEESLFCKLTLKRVIYMYKLS